MAWTAPRTYVTAEVLTSAILNVDIRDNFGALSTHGHSGSAGDGSTTLGNLVKAIFTDAAAPAAPGAGLTSLYAVSGTPRIRSGAGGADTELSLAGHTHTPTEEASQENGSVFTASTDTVDVTDLTTSFVEHFATTVPAFTGSNRANILVVGITTGQGSGAGGSSTDTWQLKVNGSIVLTGTLAHSGNSNTASDVDFFIDTSPVATQTVTVEVKATGTAAVIGITVAQILVYSA